MKIGILGTGHLAEYLVRGAQSSAVEFVLAPRNAQVSARLAKEFGCTVAQSDQAVVDCVDMVLVCLPAATGLAILQGLRFRAGQSVCSAMAGAGIDDLRRAVAPASGFCAMMPGYANAYSAGPSLLYPPDWGWAEFLQTLGPVHQISTAREFEVAAVFGAMSGASVFLMRHLADWYAGQGLEPELARRLVAETLRGNAEVLLRSDESLQDICAGVTTPGGITVQLLSDLDQVAALDAWHHAMDRVLDRIAPGARSAKS